MRPISETDETAADTAVEICLYYSDWIIAQLGECLPALHARSPAFGLSTTHTMGVVPHAFNFSTVAASGVQGHLGPYTKLEGNLGYVRL